MFAKILGIILIIIGGSMALGVLFHLFGTIFAVLWALIKLIIPLILLYVGYRLISRDSDY
jgi:hypothetical protein